MLYHRIRIKRSDCTAAGRRSADDPP